MSPQNEGSKKKRSCSRDALKNRLAIDSELRWCTGLGEQQRITQLGIYPRGSTTSKSGRDATTLDDKVAVNPEYVVLVALVL